MPLVWAPVNRNRSQVCRRSRRCEREFPERILCRPLRCSYLGHFPFPLWQPQRQIELHNLHLLAHLEKHDWKAVGEFIGDGYQDRWGNDRDLLLERLPQVFRAFGQTRIESGPAALRREEARGYWTAKITIKGTGEFADFIQSRVNSLEAPFEFEWQHGATWLWDWKLIAVRNPELEISDYTP